MAHKLREEEEPLTGYSLLNKLFEDFNIDFTSNEEQLGQKEESKKISFESDTPKQNGAHQRSRELEEIQKYTERQREAAREKAAARAKEAMFMAISLVRPSASNPARKAPEIHTEQQCSKMTGNADDGALIRCCLRSAIPSIAATTVTDVLELINLDVLNRHLGLIIDLSDAWQRLLRFEAAFKSIETFLGKCAPDTHG